MDEWTGCDACPITLNKYLYADADGANNRDPSGLATLLGVTSAGNNQSVLRGAQTTGSRKAIEKVSTARVIKIFTAMEWVGAVPHWFMVAEGPTGNWRYDFGPINLAKGIISDGSNLLMRRYYESMSAFGKKTKYITRMNYFQWLSWSSIVLGINRARVEEQLWRREIPGLGGEYCLFGKNCISMRDKWVIEAIAIAKVMGK